MTLMRWAIDVPHKQLQCDTIYFIFKLDSVNHKKLFSTNCSLKLGYMKKEFWVIVDKYVTVKILFEMY